MADRCSGDCCRLFFQARSPIEWEHRRRRAQQVLDKYRGEDADYDKPWLEELYIADMLVFVYTLTHRILAPGRWEHPVKGSRWHFYTCRHFDGSNCTAYDKRPRMCSEYPHYGKDHACRYPKCTWHHGKYPRVKDVRGTRVSAWEEEFYAAVSTV